MAYYMHTETIGLRFQGFQALRNVLMAKIEPITETKPGDSHSMALLSL
jgi:hypothetical protein